MKTRTILFTALIIGTIFSAGYAGGQIEPSAQSPNSSSISANEKLVVLWTSGDREVALKSDLILNNIKYESS